MCHKILTSKICFYIPEYQNSGLLYKLYSSNLAYHLLQLIIVTGINFNLIALLEPKLLCFFQYNGNRHIASFFVQYYSEKSFWTIILHMCHITQYLFTKKIIKSKNKTFSISELYNVVTERYLINFSWTFQPEHLFNTKQIIRNVF